MSDSKSCNDGSCHGNSRSAAETGTAVLSDDLTAKDYRKAFLLGVFTIVYNLAEGVISTIFGFADETLALAGFGFDSFIEVISGVGILVMVVRIRNNPGSQISRFEITALRITGLAFFFLSAGLAAGIILSLIYGQRPESTFWGVVVSLASLAAMSRLVWSKRRVGRRLRSDPILADANCTLVCIYMSMVLLASSLLFELTGFTWADVLGAIGLIWFSIREGLEALEKAREKRYGCSC